MARASFLQPLRSARGRALLGLALGLGALGLVRLAGHAPAAVEDLYSTRAYPVINAVQRGLFGLVPGSVAGLGLVLAGVLVLVRCLRGARRVRRGERGWLAETGAVAADGLLAAALVYAAFVGLWGLNHARLPYAVHAGLEPEPARTEELERTALELVTLCNRTYAALDPDAFAPGWRERGLQASVAHGFEVLARDVPAVDGGAPLLRFPLASPVLSRLGITGIYSPFTGEAHVNTDVPANQQPFAACHEVAHQRGFAREDEANFIAWQVCLRSGDPALRFSAALRALAHCVNALGRADPGAALAVLEGLDEGVLEARRASHAYWRARQGVVSKASRRANDAYLRSQGQAEGVQSYGRMLDLLLAERRRAGGIPSLLDGLDGGGTERRQDE